MTAPEGSATGGPARLQRPQAVLFDWDNTLIDTWAVIHDALNGTLVEMGHEPWTLTQTKARVRNSLRDSFPRLFGADWERAAALYSDAYAAMHLERLTAMPGAPEMLDALLGRGLYLGVVSNKMGPFLRREATRLGWRGKFRSLIGAGDAPRDKPAVDPVDLALAGSGIGRGGDVWFVGDTDIDMACARNAGCAPVLLRATMPQAGEFDGIRPLGWVADCAGLAELLAQV